MSTLIFDTHDLVKRLTEVGMPEKQAEILASSQARLVDDRLATKDDLKALNAEVRRDIAEVKSDIQSLRADTESGLAALKAETKSDFEKSELRLKHDLTVRFGLMLAGAVAIIVSMVKLL